MLLPPSDLSDFNSMVTPIEVEAYDILKCRSGACNDCLKSLIQSTFSIALFFFLTALVVVRSPPLRSPMCGRAPRRRLITPIPGQHFDTT